MNMNASTVDNLIDEIAESVLKPHRVRRKYRRAEPLLSLAEVEQHINNGGHFYYIDKFMHGAFVLSMRLETIQNAIRGGKLFRAEYIGIVR
jgi:hypothetical protein